MIGPRMGNIVFEAVGCGNGQGHAEEEAKEDVPQGLSGGGEGGWRREERDFRTAAATVTAAISGGGCRGRGGGGGRIDAFLHHSMPKEEENQG